MPWWVWAMGGLLLLGAELLVPADFYLLFLGVAAVGVGLVTALGLTSSFDGQLFAFSLFAVASLLGLRVPIVRRLRRRADGQRGVEPLIGEPAILTEPLPADGTARAELRGTTWTARNASGRALPVGTRCRVARADGLTLWLRPESGEGSEA